MRTRILTLAALILALESSVVAAETNVPPANLKSAAAFVVVDRLLASRDSLGLSAGQAAQLTRLSVRLHHDRGHVVIAGLDRVPSKSVPRIERIKTTATEALRLASAILTAEQLAKAAGLLQRPTA